MKLESIRSWAGPTRMNLFLLLVTLASVPLTPAFAQQTNPEPGNNNPGNNNPNPGPAPGPTAPAPQPSPNMAPVPTPTDLGFSQLQQNTSAGVLATCRGFVANGANNSLEQDLFDACSSMVQSENQLNGSGPTTNSRDISAASLGSGYQNIATEESMSPIRIGTNAASGLGLAVLARAQALRGGATGFGYTPGNGGTQYARYPGVSGGTAGDGEDYISGRLSGFVNTFGGIGDTALTTRTNSSDFYNIGFVAGLDYRVLDNFIVGLAGGYSHMDLDFNRSLNVAGGSVDSDTAGLSAYATYYLDGFFMDGFFSYGWSDFDIARQIFINSNNPNIPVVSRTATGDTDGTQWNLAFQTGYNFNTGGFSYGPYVKVNYLNIQADSYTEQGAAGLNLIIDEQQAESLQSVVGAQVSYALSQSFGVLNPYLRFQWQHEFRDPSRSLVARYQNDPRNNPMVAFSDSPDRDYFTLNTGMSAVFANGIQAFFNYNALLDNDLISGHLFTVGARMEF